MRRFVDELLELWIGFLYGVVVLFTAVATAGYWLVPGPHWPAWIFTGILGALVIFGIVAPWRESR